MKKYLLGLFAIVLAVGFSAFTNKKVQMVPTETSFAHWYSVVNGQVGAEITAYQNKTKSQVLSLDACQDETSTACLVASQEPLQSEDELPSQTPESGNPSNIENRINTSFQ